jgi:hypothetical protein
MGIHRGPEQCDPRPLLARSQVPKVGPIVLKHPNLRHDLLWLPVSHQLQSRLLLLRQVPHNPRLHLLLGIRKLLSETTLLLYDHYLRVSGHQRMVVGKKSVRLSLFFSGIPLRVHFLVLSVSRIPKVRKRKIHPAE